MQDNQLIAPIKTNRQVVSNICRKASDWLLKTTTRHYSYRLELGDRMQNFVRDEQGDVPGWVLVVLMTTGLVTAIWAIAAPRISSILRNSLDSMNNVR